MSKIDMAQSIFNGCIEGIYVLASVAFYFCNEA